MRVSEQAGYTRTFINRVIRQIVNDARIYGIITFTVLNRARIFVCIQKVVPTNQRPAYALAIDFRLQHVPYKLTHTHTRARQNSCVSNAYSRTTVRT